MTARVFVLLTLSVLALGLATPQSAFASYRGYWNCIKGGWSAYTTVRVMEGGTAFECGGICGDDSHTQPTSWVDFTGGISQSQEDHSDSFFGPDSGEWNGCASFGSSQTSTGVRWIEGVNQGWDRWPTTWFTAHWTASNLSSFNGRTAPMNSPYGSVYDLDCAPGWLSWMWGGSCPKDVIGTIYWDNFPVTSHLVDGDPVVADPTDPYGWGFAKWELRGDTEAFCSTPANGCESVVCSDLHVRSTFQCTWVAPDGCPYDHMSCL
jgi:hypothetical protein